MKIVGLDPSLTGTGICVLDTGSTLELAPGVDMGDGVPFHYHTATIKTSLTGPQRLVHIRDKVARVCMFADLVLIEGYSFGSKGAGVFQTAELGGLLRVMLHESGVRWIEVAPTQLKKFATGKGNANKELIAAWIQKRWVVMFANNNEADAFVLAKIGEALTGWPESGGGLTVPQKEVIAALRGEEPAKKGKKRAVK